MNEAISQEAVRAALTIFPHLDKTLIHFATDQLDICEGQLVGVGEAVWSSVLGEKAVEKLTIIEKSDISRATSYLQAPLITSSTASTSHSAAVRKPSQVDVTAGLDRGPAATAGALRRDNPSE